MPVSRSSDRREILARVTQLRQWTSGDQRAPHKPLLILLALANVQRGGHRLMSFADIEDPLGRLLEEFGPPRRRQRPEFPFWRLQNDGLWEVHGPGHGAIGASGDPSLTALRDVDTRGGFLPDVDAALREDDTFVSQVAMTLLENHFPPTLHEDLLDAVGLQVRAVVTRALARDPRFRIEVLRAYEYACAMCGYDGQLETTSVGVEAAHVRWFALGGPDTLDNALALCSLHHRLFDRGAIGADPDGRILVSRLFRGSHPSTEAITDLQHQTLRRPQVGLMTPGPEHLDWHQREVFRGPARLHAIAAEGRES